MKSTHVSDYAGPVWRQRFSRRTRQLEWTAGGEHPFTFTLRQPRWPPFYATAFFLPRVNLKIKNAGPVLPRTTFGLYIAAYDSPIGSIPSAQIEWVDTEHKEVEAEWQPGESKRLRFRVRSRNLPHEGTYVLKLLVTKFLPLGTPYEETLGALAEVDDVLPETKEALMQSSRDVWEHIGIDPHREQTGAFKGQGIHTIFIVDYFRVEPISSVLTFLVVVGTLMLALATLGLVVVTLVN